MPIPAAILTKARGLTPGSIIELFLLDLTNLVSTYDGTPGLVYAFHNSNDYGTAPIVFQGISYYPYPIAVTGLEVSSGTDKQPRPQISLSNLASFMSSLLAEYDDLTGAKLTRLLTIFDYLDAQPAHDATQEFPRAIFYVSKKVSETRASVTLELSTQIDIEGVQLPRRPITANACVWRYRSGDGCDYVGDAVSDEFDANFAPTNPRGAWNAATVYATHDSVYIILNGVKEYFVAVAPSAAGLYPRFNPAIWKRDVCIKTLGACKKRFGDNAVLPFGAFPAIIRAPLS